VAKKHYAYLVKWRDSCSVRGWNSMASAGDEVTTITSVGWIVRETKTELTITTSISDHGSAMDPLTIPREAITKKTRLRHYIAGN
jgi:hypothetical protein